MAHQRQSVQKEDITAQNTFCDAIILEGGFNFSLYGSGWVATVEVQKKYDGESDWRPVGQYTSPTELPGFEDEEGISYRAGVPTGGYTSGTVKVRLSQ
jgi:hypothetical protein